MNFFIISGVTWRDAQQLARYTREETAALLVACPTCHVGHHECCRTRETDRFLRRPHRTRVKRGKVITKLDGRKA